MERTAYYRAYAAQCMEAAERASDPTLKRLLVEMAAVWHRLSAQDSAVQTQINVELPYLSSRGPQVP
jgi:hypothetical protein